MAACHRGLAVVLLLPQPSLRSFSGPQYYQGQNSNLPQLTKFLPPLEMLLANLEAREETCSKSAGSWGGRGESKHHSTTFNSDTDGSNDHK